MNEADYIIIGAGSAGCILAERLSADPDTSVLLLEAGGSDASFWVSLPLGYSRLNSDPKRTWRFTTQPDDGLDGRSILWPRGRLVGGSGSINAMVYCRGLPGDFDDWEAEGAAGWGWDAVRPVFERLETRVAANGGKTGSGPIHISDVSDQIHPVNRHFFDAALELGLPMTADMNGADWEGAGVYNINTRNGLRCSSAKAFLHPALRRRNLRLRIHAQVRRILIDHGRATGVELVDGGTLRARREVIVSAGAIGSPQLLQLSGIGPGRLLQDKGIEVIADNANVGGNLQDHIATTYVFRAREATLNAQLRPLWGQGLAALDFALRRKGPLTLSVNQCGGFVRSTPDLPRPDQQLYFNPVSYKIEHREGKRSKVTLDPFNGFIICAQPARPTSRGRIDLRSADPLAPPDIRPNSLATEEDRQTVIAGGRLCQRLMATRTLSALTLSAGTPSLPTLDDEGLLADFRTRATTVFHPVSTCRMGRNADTSVLDSRLKVHGLDGLRVVDASAFPNITSGNTNAPTMMLALKGADIILDDRKRAAS